MEIVFAEERKCRKCPRHCITWALVLALGLGPRQGQFPRIWLFNKTQQSKFWEKLSVSDQLSSRQKITIVLSKLEFSADSLLGCFPVLNLRLGRCASGQNAVSDDDDHSKSSLAVVAKNIQNN